MSVRDRLTELSEIAEKRLPKPESFSQRLRGSVVTARIGRWLAVSFGICFLTGLISHFVQHPLAGPWRWSTSPAWLYRVTQGVHITSGVASIPLLAVKLWSVAPRFWRRPLFGGLLDGLERLSILVLIAAAGFQLLTGLLNVAEVYAWDFYFPNAHFAVAFVAVGAIVLHIAVKLPVIRTALGEPVEQALVPTEDSLPAKPRGLTRRGVLGIAAAGVGIGVLTTVGDKLHFLSPVSVFAQRRGSGPQGLPVNQTAAATGVTKKASSTSWKLVVAGAAKTVSLSRADLQALPQRRVRLPIACVEGWSVNADWEGVPLSALLALAEQEPVEVRMMSMERSIYGTSMVSAQLAADPDTLVALKLNGEELDLDHGFPARLIAPNRPGAMQTKWLGRIEVA